MRNVDRKYPFPALDYRSNGKAIQDNQRGEDKIENPVSVTGRQIWECGIQE